MGKPLRVLLVEDSEDDVLLTVREIKKGGYDPLHERVENAGAMRKALQEKTWDVILCDYQMPQFNGLAAIALLKETGIDIPLIIVSGVIGEETAADCMRYGAHDYVMKGNLSRLVPAIERELREAESRSKRRQAEETIRQMAYHDSLTGLPNRKLFSDRLGIALAQAKRNQKGVAVTMLDLDYFKDMNDTLGHDVGDHLLKAAAARLSAALRKGDTVTRFGGDEFVLILPDLKGIEDVIQVAQKIVESFRKPFLIDTHELLVTTSIGIAVYPHDGTDEGILLKNADIAMYQVKQTGRDRYQIYKEA
jgi:diguanylate cyclase (GGDEF)-like protein